MQSMPVSPPPITITFLPSALISPLGGRLARRPALAGCDPAVALVEVVHRRMDPDEVVVGHIEPARHP